jgi:Zn-dependent protease
MLGLDPPEVISRIIVLLIAFTIHEFAHAWTANEFGDDTPRLYGRLTLNPIAHLDLMGTLLLIVAGFGWAKPVPINPIALQRRSRAAVMWVSLAGPLSNLLMAIIAAIPIRLGLVSLTFSTGILPTLGDLFFYFIFINLTLMLFNLIPLSPLDGEKILEYFLPPNLTRAWETIRPYSPLILMSIVFLGPLVGINVLDWIIGPPLSAMWHLLTGM